MFIPSLETAIKGAFICILGPFSFPLNVCHFVAIYSEHRWGTHSCIALLLFFVCLFVCFILKFLLKYACIKQITLPDTNSLGPEHMHMLNSNSDDFHDLTHINDDYFTSTDYFH